MRDRFPGLLAGALLFALLGGFTSGCKKEQAQAAPPPPAVTVARPIEREVVEWDEYPGRLVAKETVEVRSRVSGFLEKADFEEGSIVQAGQLLFVIDPRPFEALLAKSKAEVQRAQAQRDYAINDFKRLEGLRPSGGASELEVENARQRMLEAEASVASAQADERTAALNVEWTRVTAPISGRISNKLVTEGNLVNGGGAASGTVGGGGGGGPTLLTTIASLDPIYAYMDVDEQSVLKYQRLSQERKRISARDMRIPIFMGLSNDEGFPHEGEVDFVDNRIDPETGTLRGRGVFANPFPHYLTPGLFARLRIPGSGRYVAILIPDLAIGTDQDQRFVLTVGDDEKVVRKAVKPGAAFGRFRAIESGISASDRVIINGVQRARPGAKVTVKEEALNADDVPRTAPPGSAATQSLPTTRRLPSTRAVPPTTAPTGAAAMIGAEL